MVTTSRIAANFLCLFKISFVDCILLVLLLGSITLNLSLVDYLKAQGP